MITMPTGFKSDHLLRLPASRRSGPEGDTVITTFNTENLLYLPDNNPARPGDNRNFFTPERIETKLTKLALAIRLELRRPEIMILQEVGGISILQELGRRVNAVSGTNYVATSFKTSDRRGLEVGFLWDSSRVELLEAAQLSGPEVEAAFGPSSPSPGREPIVGVFKIRGQRITIIGNHFKSMLGNEAFAGLLDDELSARITEAQRKDQARVVRRFVNSLLDHDPEALVMVAGDFNDTQFGQRNENEEADYPLAILEGRAGEVPLTDLITLKTDAESDFTFIHNETAAQMLDHILVSPALLKLFVAVDILHFNAGFPPELSDDPHTTRRSSDHDPVEGRFNFQSRR